MIKVTNAEQFRGQVQRWLQAVEVGATKATMKMALDAQEFAMSKSPIWTGDFGSNWNVSAGSPNTSFREGSQVGPVTHLWGRGDVNFTNYKIGTPVYITNNAVHMGEKYAGMIDRGEISFRQWNVEQDRTDFIVAKTHRYLAEKYKVITKGMMT